MTRPAAVLFDMDGTLIDSEKVWDVSLADLATRLGGVLSPRTRDLMIGSNMDNTMRMMFTDLGLELDVCAMEEGCRYLAKRTEELFHEGLPWRPGAAELLRAVREAGVPTALVTSTERALTEVALDTIGREFFDVTVCGDEVDGLNKPLPEPYLKAARLLGVDPAACVAVEDSPTGTKAAVAAGCTVLVVPCDVDVPGGERRVLRESLVGVDVALLGSLLS
ncbi:HAD family phosphatase [Kutzneria viridogrisea]|uniref:HAD-superfamily hydrolase, subfamily IA, variant3 n=2 Tax=Kutzneria TaxID=43356 RepID=W5W6J3_9PSEU|nr:HAD family phosphatase [Kutzneria albida]AHH96385.1 HAD-superfamily hydrolase, subfamily IA, variant3 [Kutzneria albida DSM 43870]MBA8928400.1 HAD superfamily hydrolase (TIGR01509 family) [Kutzneria viridogrisea]